MFMCAICYLQSHKHTFTNTVPSHIMESGVYGSIKLFLHTILAIFVVGHKGIFININKVNIGIVVITTCGAIFNYWSLITLEHVLQNLISIKTYGKTGTISVKEYDELFSLLVYYLKLGHMWLTAWCIEITIGSFESSNVAHKWYKIKKHCLAKNLNIKKHTWTYCTCTVYDFVLKQIVQNDKEFSPVSCC